MKYKLIASCDCLQKRKWATLRKFVKFGDYSKVIKYMTKRCAVKDEYEIDSEKDTDEVIFDIGTYRMTYRDMMCEECFLYAWI
jgi:hypothetical protein